MRNMPRIGKMALTAVGVLSLAALASGCGQQTAAGTAHAAPPVKYHFYETILTGGMTGKPGWPEFMPADFTLPANADVTMTITSFDDGAAAVPAQYGKITGTNGGDATIDGQSETQVPVAQVAHTFTISSLNLNVPIPVAKSAQQPTVVTFTFHTPKSGVDTWQCYAPCGSGSDGWEGAMATDGYMTGKVTFSNN